MASNKTPAERLDAMSEYFFGPDGIAEQIKALQAKMLPDDAECDKVSAELGALYDEYAGVRQDALDTRNILAEIVDELRDMVEPIKTMEAQARLKAFAICPETAKPFTAGQIKDRVAVALAADGEYQKLVFGGVENKDKIALIETQARIDARGVDPATARPYTTEQTKDRAAVALGKDEKYQKLTARRRLLEGQKAGALAILADCETALSMYRNRNRALCAQLGALTARTGR